MDSLPFYAPTLKRKAVSGKIKLDAES